MAGEYTGVNGVARKVKAQDVGISGIARKVAKGFVGVANVARKFCFAQASVNTVRVTFKLDSGFAGGEATVWANNVVIGELHGFMDDTDSFTANVEVGAQIRVEGTGYRNFPFGYNKAGTTTNSFSNIQIATVYKGNIIKNLIMDCQSYTKYRPNETTGGIFVSWRRKEELPTGA